MLVLKLRPVISCHRMMQIMQLTSETKNAPDCRWGRNYLYAVVQMAKCVSFLARTCMRSSIFGFRLLVVTSQFDRSSFVHGDNVGNEMS